MTESLVSRLASAVRSRPIPALPKPASLPERDDPEEAGVEDLGTAEGQSFIIEYADAGGELSTRRVSVHGLRLGSSGVPSLYARCHERQAMRAFRVDRIRRCIDFDGEVQDDVAGFLEFNFGMSRSWGSARDNRAESDRWDRILSHIRAPATVLAALSNSDGSVRESETDAAAAWLIELARGFEPDLTQRELWAIESYVRRLRPDEAALGRALETVAELSPEAIKALLAAGLKVIDADGRLDPAELRLLDEICRELTGVGLHFRRA